MLSKKLTFSLACLIVVIGFALVLPTHAHDTGDHDALNTTISATDVSSEGGVQLELAGTTDTSVTLSLTFAKDVRAINGDAATVTQVDNVLDAADIVWQVYDSDGLPRASDASFDVIDIGDETGTALSASMIAKNFTIILEDTTATGGLVVSAGDLVYVELPMNEAQYANSAALVAARAHAEDHLLGRNKRAHFRFTIVNDDGGAPNVHAFVKLDTPEEAVGFVSAGVRTDFQAEVMLTEKPKEFTINHIGVTNATITSFIPGDPITENLDRNSDGVLVAADGDVDVTTVVSTGRVPSTIYPYLLNVKPNLNSTADVVLTVKTFEDMVIPPNNFDPATSDNAELRVPVDATAVTELKPFAETQAVIDAHPRLKVLQEQRRIPANGYLVLAYGPDADDSGVVSSPNKPADKKTDAQKLYHIEYNSALPFPGNDLSNFFRNGGTIQLLYKDIDGSTTGANADYGYTGNNRRAVARGDLVINEIMWGLDQASANSQYIEIHNTTSSDLHIDKNEWVLSVGEASAATLAVYDVIDTVSNNSNGSYWEAKGQDGATIAALGYEARDLISMSRVADDGTMAASWSASMRPSANLNGLRIGTPGAPNVAPPAPAPTPEPTTPVAGADDIEITEIMVDSSNGQLPQWIELTNMTDTKLSLNGWSVNISNSAADPVPASNTDLSGDIPAKQTVLIVSGEGRQGTRSLPADRVFNTGKMLLGETAFLISLLTPSGDTGDTAGNLSNPGWPLQTNPNVGRFSLVRAGENGTQEGSWEPAEAMPLAYVQTYYGSRADVGTPGWYRVDGQKSPLPVELSLFIAKRDSVTGAVEIRWETQSETNNAGFFIKRSESKTGTFAAINAVMIPGAGTTSEKQSYTYADTTAKPNVVYYYQIEDVSLDGARQTLTAGQRLKGHLSAAGKATVTWGELKSQE